MYNINDIAINLCKTPAYPRQFPYHPSARYPEYAGSECVVDPNEVYEGVRNLLMQLSLDRVNCNTPLWNPFGEFIRPGMTVFIKPNTVVHEHEKGKDIFSVIAHASVIRPLLDYVVKALDGKGKIIVGDSQLYSSDFEKAMQVSRIGELLTWYKTQTSIPITWFDLRINKARRTWLYGKWAREKIEQDPRGFTFVDLKDASCFKGIDAKKLRIAIASYKNMYKHHANGKHEYLFPQSFLDSDVVINVSKLKTHRRTGVTLALKNFMGIPSLKDSLPHFMVGTPEEGGDQYIHPNLRKQIGTFLHDQIQTSPHIPVKFVCAVIKKLLWNSHYIVPFKDTVSEAMWYGNDTLWRTLSDLNRIVMYADIQGNLSSKQQRTVFNIIDGIIGGENEGPLAPDPKPCGILFGGFNQVAIDAVAATAMGFDIAKIPLIGQTLLQCEGPMPLFSGKVTDIRILQQEDAIDLEELKKSINFHFKPHPGWVNHIEL